MDSLSRADCILVALDIAISKNENLIQIGAMFANFPLAGSDSAVILST